MIHCRQPCMSRGSKCLRHIQATGELFNDAGQLAGRGTGHFALQRAYCAGMQQATWNGLRSVPRMRKLPPGNSMKWLPPTAVHP